MNKKRYIKIFLYIMFFIYIVMALYFLFFAESMGRTMHSSGYRYNLIPFKEIKRFIMWSIESDVGFESMILNILGNIFFFTPLGFFVPAVCKFKNKGLWTFLVALMSTLSVEIIQLITKIGSFDIDDILLNTLGAIIGYYMYVAAKKILVILRSKSEVKSQ